MMELPLYWWAKKVVCSEPFLYRCFIATRKAERRRLSINKNTSIVIDGFPRSGNTFSVVVFSQWQQSNVSIAHHTHVPATVIEGCRRRLPVVVLVRNPVDACASLSTFNGRNPSTLLNEWIWFYRRCWRDHNRFLIAPFEVVVNDFGTVVDAVNNRWKTSFNSLNMNIETRNAAYTRINEIASFHGQGEDKVAMPSSFRKEHNEEAKEILLRHGRQVQEANALYGKYLELAYQSGISPNAERT